MTGEEAMHSDLLFRARLQSLLAVDDLVAAVHAEVEAAGQLDNTSVTVHNGEEEGEEEG
jgi:hypothetical protein